jgi:hypothetical protein
VIETGWPRSVTKKSWVSLAPAGRPGTWKARPMPLIAGGAAVQPARRISRVPWRRGAEGQLRVGRAQLELAGRPERCAEDQPLAALLEPRAAAPVPQESTR